MVSQKVSPVWANITQNGTNDLFVGSFASAFVCELREQVNFYLFSWISSEDLKFLFPRKKNFLLKINWRIFFPYQTWWTFQLRDKFKDPILGMLAGVLVIKRPTTEATVFVSSTTCVIWTGTTFETAKNIFCWTNTKFRILIRHLQSTMDVF